jgi:hypothetical protein
VPLCHDDDVIGPQCWGQNLLDVEFEGFVIDRPVDEPWSRDAIVARGGQEGHGLPAATRYLGFEPVAARRPASQRSHIGFGPGLVDGHQTGGINPIPVLDPLRPPAGNIRTVLLGSNQRLFL